MCAVRLTFVTSATRVVQSRRAEPLRAAGARSAPAAPIHVLVDRELRALRAVPRRDVHGRIGPARAPPGLGGGRGDGGEGAGRRRARGVHAGGGRTRAARAVLERSRVPGGGGRRVRRARPRRVAGPGGAAARLAGTDG